MIHRANLTHFFTPLKAPLAAIGGGGLALLGLDWVPPGMWLAIAASVVVLLAARTVLLFEFREHERKEEKLLAAIVTTGDSFDVVAAALRGGIADATKSVAEMRGVVNEHTVSILDHDRRIARIEESPLVTRTQHHIKTEA